MRILVTGAAGTVGQVLTDGLPGLGHELRGLDVREPPDPSAYSLGWESGSCLDSEVIHEAVRDIDAVVHLAGSPGETSLPDSLESHVHSTGRLLEGMLAHGVRRIAFASSNHAVGRTPRCELLTTGARPRPDTFYGVSKAATEALLSLYADRFGIHAVAMRIGSLAPAPRTRRELATWLSPADCVRMVDAAVSAGEPGLHVLYGVSANTAGWWDLAPGRRLGYEPRDDAQRYAEVIPDRAEDDADGAHVGGPFTAVEHERSAFDDDSG